MSQHVIVERLYDRTPSAQQWRRNRLEPDAIREELRKWSEHFDGFGASVAAVGLIEMAQMLECSDAEFAEHVRAILALLDEVPQGTRAVGQP